MRFLTMVKGAENQGPPPKALMDAIARGPGESVRAGRVVAMGGLAPSAASTRVRASRRKVTVIDGPFTESKEVIGGYAVLECDSKEEAVESARWLMQLHVDLWPEWEGETEVRQMFGSDDLSPTAP